MYLVSFIPLAPCVSLLELRTNEQRKNPAPGRPLPVRSLPCAAGIVQRFRNDGNEGQLVAGGSQRELREEGTLWARAVSTGGRTWMSF
jgi:hypothetical protein